MSALVGPFIVTAALLAGGGGAKLARPAPTARALREMGVPASPTAVRIGAGAELAIAASALVDGAPPFAALVAASYLGFAAFVLAALRRGVPLSSCGCFGVQEAPPTAVHLALNLAAAATAGVVALGLADGGGLRAITTMDGSLLVQAAFVVATGAATWFAYTALTLLPRVRP